MVIFDSISSICLSVWIHFKQVTSIHVRTHMSSNTSLTIFHDSTLDYSEQRCSAARAQGTLRQWGSRKQYEIDRPVPFCFSEGVRGSECLVLLLF